MQDIRYMERPRPQEPVHRRLRREARVRLGQHAHVHHHRGPGDAIHRRRATGGNTLDGEIGLVCQDLPNHLRDQREVVVCLHARHNRYNKPGADTISRLTMG